MVRVEQAMDFTM